MSYIGITENGDPSMEFSWLDIVNYDQDCLGVILITKGFLNPNFQQAVRYIQKPCIIHADISGWGATRMEPYVPRALETVKSIRAFIDHYGFPASNFVLRIDPIIPDQPGLRRAEYVVKLAQQYLPDIHRIRISIYDDYAYSHQEFIKRGYTPIDNVTTWKNERERRPNPLQVQLVAQTLMAAAAPGQIFETCCEPELVKTYPSNFIQSGCLSKTDCEIMHISIPEDVSLNGLHKYGCQCLTMKREIMPYAVPCQMACAYCNLNRNVRPKN